MRPLLLQNNDPELKLSLSIIQTPNWLNEVKICEGQTHQKIYGHISDNDLQISFSCDTLFSIHRLKLCEVGICSLSPLIKLFPHLHFFCYFVSFVPVIYYLLFAICLSGTIKISFLSKTVHLSFDSMPPPSSMF